MSTTTAAGLVFPLSSNEFHNYTISLVPLGLVSLQTRMIFQWIFFCVISEVMCVFGTAANIINIICFLKQGLHDSVNISLLGLAISDLGCLVTMMWVGICHTPAFYQLDLPFDPIEVQYLTAGGPHIIFARVTSCITVFITLERCLCVTMPLKVKTVLTSQRVKFIIVSIFIVIIGMLAPGYNSSKLAPKFIPKRNKTIVGLVFNSNRLLVDGIIFAVGGVFVELAAFITVVVCTIILVIKLRGKAKWRQMSSSIVQTEKSCTRDHKVTKMVIVISVFFIVAFTPTCMTLVSMIVVPEMTVIGKYKNLVDCLFGVCFTLESTNSATKIFIYYHRSSKYKAVLRKCLGK